MYIYQDEKQGEHNLQLQALNKVTPHFKPTRFLSTKNSNIYLQISNRRRPIKYFYCISSHIQ